jgi:predicted Rossmann fold flavoprotein
MKKRINIIGGGAAGLFAACIARQNGAEVTLFERKSSPGRKLKITGKGRCNITNMAPLSEFLEHFNQRGRFLRHAFNLFFNEDLINYFEKIGIPVVIERGERVFPSNQSAKILTETLIQHAVSIGVQIKTKTRVSRLIVEDNAIIGIQCQDSDHVYHADVHILATGGKSYPLTGSSGDGYQMVSRFGHTITPLSPSLVPLETNETIPKALSQLLLKNVRIQAIVDGKSIKPEFGELQFTPSGLSGATILTLSRVLIPALNHQKPIIIDIDLKPALDHKKLDKRLLKEFSENANKRFKTILKNLLPKDLISFCIDQTGIDPEKAGQTITAEERKKLKQWLKSLKFNISKSRSWSEAIVTAGGVKTNEINPKTLESRLIKHLYFAGEIIDVDADTGGFNLQAAFSTAYLAALSACQNS